VSHLSRIKTRIADRELLEAALTRLGYEVEDGPVIIRSFGQEREVDLCVKLGGLLGSRRVGFVRSQGVYDIVADWWGVRETSGAKLRSALEEAEREVRGETERLQREMQAEMERVQREIKRQYAITTTKEKLAEQGFQIVEEGAQADGQVRVLLRRVV
jgi:hypothetical protein